MARTCILRAFGLQINARSSFSAVTLVLFRFRLYAFVEEAAALRSIVFRYAGAPTATRVSSFFPDVSLEMSPFPSILVPLSFALSMESTTTYLVPGTFFPFGWYFSTL